MVEGRSGLQVAGSRVFKGRDAGVTAGSGGDTPEIHGLCFLYAIPRLSCILSAGKSSLVICRSLHLSCPCISGNNTHHRYYRIRRCPSTRVWRNRQGCQHSRCHCSQPVHHSRHLHRWCNPLRWGRKCRSRVRS